MRYSVLALATVPDTDTTQRIFGLDDLDRKSVSKVLFHRRKQQTGWSESLRWDQRAIAGVTLIQHSLDKVQIDSMGLSSWTESQMLEAVYKAVLRDGCLVCWDGMQADLPLLHFRTLMHGVSFPAYWHAIDEGRELHFDCRDWLAPPAGDRPQLDETARKLGYPGMLNRSDDSTYEAWLQDRHAEVQAYSDIAALNTYLIANRLFSVTGRTTRHDAARVERNLVNTLGQLGAPHFTEFLNHWDAR